MGFIQQARVQQSMSQKDLAIRRRVAERTGAQGTDAYSLLEQIGRDCVGAMQFLPEEIEAETITYKSFGLTGLGGFLESRDSTLSSRKTTAQKATCQGRVAINIISLCKRDINANAQDRSSCHFLPSFAR